MIDLGLILKLLIIENILIIKKLYLMMEKIKISKIIVLLFFKFSGGDFYDEVDSIKIRR